MRNSIEKYLKNKNIVLKDLEHINFRSFEIKKRIEFFRGIDTQDRGWVIVVIDRKSRILQKDVKALRGLLQELPLDLSYEKKIFLLKAPICSKAKDLLKQEGWLVDAFV